MNFSTEQLPSGKWGIYCDSRLLAVASCPEICKTILSNLASGRRDTPVNDVNELYAVPTLKNQPVGRLPVSGLGQPLSEHLTLKTPKDIKLPVSSASLKRKQTASVKAKRKQKKSVAKTSGGSADVQAATKAQARAVS